MLEDLEQFLDESNPSGDESVTEQESLAAESVQPDADTNDNEDGDSLESQLDSMELESDSPDVLSSINQLNLIRKGLPFEYDDIEKVKEHLQKGFDYTEKTQELSEQRKEFETQMVAERQKFDEERKVFEDERAGHQEVLNNYQVLQHVLQEFSLSEPEIFDELDQMFTQRMNQFSAQHPELEALKGKFSELEKSLRGQNEQEVEKEHESIRSEWESGLKEVQTNYGAKLRSLAIKPDWSKVQEVWKSDTSNEMTVKQALFAVHGEEMQKAFAAQKRLAETKKKSQLRVGPSGTDQEVKSEKEESSLDYLNRIADEMGI